MLQFDPDEILQFYPGVDSSDKKGSISKYAGIIAIENEQLASYFKSLLSYLGDIKKTTIDINTCIEKTTDYCRSNKSELVAIGKLLSVYKLKSPEKSGENETRK